MRVLCGQLVEAQRSQQAVHALGAANGKLGELVILGQCSVGKGIQAARDFLELTTIDQPGQRGARDLEIVEITGAQKTPPGSELESPRGMAELGHHA